METFIVILVLIALLALLGGSALFYGREAGPDASKLWLTGTRNLRNMMSPAQSALMRDVGTNSNPDTDTVPIRQTPSAELEARQQALLIDDNRLRELAEELRGELTRAAGLTREFDARLNRMEQELASTKEIPATIDQKVSEVNNRHKQHFSSLRVAIQSSRLADSPHGQRRAEAISEVYMRLANVDAALSAVINPMLLPGEPLLVPDALYDDTLEWENWEDVGDRAFAFGETFNQNRFLLEPELAADIERFVALFREALTGTVYPVVQNPHRTQQHRQAMRQGLVTISDAIPPLRRELEDAWRTASVAMPDIPDDDED